MLDIIYGPKYAYHIFTTKNNGELFLFSWSAVNRPLVLQTRSAHNFTRPKPLAGSMMRCMFYLTPSLEHAQCREQLGGSGETYRGEHFEKEGIRLVNFKLVKDGFLIASQAKKGGYLVCPFFGHLFQLSPRNWPLSSRNTRPAFHRNTGIQKPPEKKRNIDCVSLFNR